MTITVYTQPSCGACIATKSHLGKLGLEFIERPMDDHARELAQRAGVSAAPLVQVDPDDPTADITVSYTWGGYRPDRIKALVA